MKLCGIYRHPLNKVATVYKPFNLQQCFFLLNNNQTVHMCDRPITSDRENLYVSLFSKTSISIQLECYPLLRESPRTISQRSRLGKPLSKICCTCEDSSHVYMKRRLSEKLAFKADSIPGDVSPIPFLLPWPTPKKRKESILKFWDGFARPSAYLYADLIGYWHVRSSSIQQDIALPHIVVVGTQSAGKSSTIEAISTVSKPSTRVYNVVTWDDW